MDSTLTWFLCLNIVVSITADPCNDHNTIDDWTRSVANGMEIACDSLLNPGWYRIISKAGELMPTECIHYGSRCGTGYSIWLNGTYPFDGETVNVTACASDFNSDNCCYKSYDIQIKNCSTFYVYNLVPVNGCPQSYCFGAELPCPVGQNSPTGYTPGCKFDPCLEMNYKELDDYRRSVKYTEHAYICDSTLEAGWYRPTSLAGDRMPTECPINGMTCGTSFPIWLNGTFPNEGESNSVTACSSSHIDGCCSRSYNIGIKNCGSFYVYNLSSTIGCASGYCFDKTTIFGARSTFSIYIQGEELPCPEGHTSPTGYTPGCKFDPCLEMNYKELDDYRRSVNYTENAYICDSTLEAGWYRPTSLAGDRMPTECPINGMTCGTSFPIWLNGTFPNEGESNSVTACSSSHIDGCCSRRYDIGVQNCGGFYVYNLSSTIGCDSGYCFGTEVPCPVGETSDNGYTPGCEFDPCQNHTVISGEDKRSAGYKVQGGTPLDDSELKNGWYRFDSYVGNDLVHSSQPIGSCGTSYPVWLNGYLPSKADKTVDRTCCITGDTDTCESTVNIQIRNCGNFMVYNISKTLKSQSAYCVGVLPVTTTPATTTTTKPPDFDSSKSEEKKKDVLIAPAVLIGLVCCALILAIVFVKCIRKSNTSQTVSCMSDKPPPYIEVTKIKNDITSTNIEQMKTARNPPPYTEADDNKTNSMAETNVITNVEQMKKNGQMC